MWNSQRVERAEETAVHIIAFFLCYFFIMNVEDMRDLLGVINMLSTKQNAQKLGFYYNLNIL
jgi:hypothetical protein